MRAVVDTNVVAYYLLGTSGFNVAAESFWRAATRTIAPALWEAELANVVGMSVRQGLLPAGKAAVKLDQAGRLGIHTVPVRHLWQGAVVRALSSGLAVYDALFVELAEREQLPLITFDRQICKAFPEIARAPV